MKQFGVSSISTPRAAHGLRIEAAGMDRSLNFEQVHDPRGVGTEFERGSDLVDKPVGLWQPFEDAGTVRT